VTTYGVTGATGGFGSHVIRVLLGKGIEPHNIVAVARDLGKASGWIARGIDVRLGNFDTPSTLRTALTGVDVLLLVSSGHVANRVEQHRAVIDAATAVGIQRVIYTSVLQADTSQMGLAADHRATEQLLAHSSLAWTILRNSWYLQLYTEDLLGTLARGMTIGSAGSARVSAAAREDYAEAAAVVMLEPGRPNTVYELGGDTSFSYPEFAATLSRLAAGLSEEDADMIADSDQAILRGELETTSRDLSQLLERPTTTLVDFLDERLALRR
jgi:NAD(P)H dehydrogenase (quinone)